MGAGFVTYTAIKILRGRFDEIHPLMLVVAGAFVAYFVRGLYA